MRIVAINGSPRGMAGMTWWALRRFIEGMGAAGAEVDTVQLAGKRIHHCSGELACWLKTPGRCIHRDDMDALGPTVMRADALVLATPVYVDGMTGLMKNFVDRLVAMADPHFELRDGHFRHVVEGSSPSRIALVSVSGFPELDNFDPLVAHIKAICRNMNAKYAGAVLRPAAPINSFAAIRHPLKTRAVIKAIRRAGGEFVHDGRISDESAREVSAEIVLKETYMKLANRWFDSEIKKAHR